MEERKKVIAKEVAKGLVSGLVGTCAGLTVGKTLSCLTASMPIFGVEKVDKVIKTVGVFGMETMIGTKVGEDVDETIGSMETLVKYRIEMNKAKKAQILAERQAKED